MASGHPGSVTHPRHSDGKQKMINEPPAFSNHFFPAQDLITTLVVTLQQNKRDEMSFASRQAPRP